MKPGWKTSECWQAIIAQGLAFLVLLGVMSSNEGKTLESALGDCVTAIFTIVVNGVIVINYIRTRFVLKHAESVKEVAKFVLIGTAGLALWLIGDTSALHAQSVLPWRNGIQQQLKQHDAQINQMIGQ